jgi:hypothetical protein
MKANCGAGYYDNNPPSFIQAVAAIFVSAMLTVKTTHLNTQNPFPKIILLLIDTLPPVSNPNGIGFKFPQRICCQSTLDS